MCVYGTKDFVGVNDAQGYLLSQTWRSVCFSDARCNSRSYKITTQIWVINCKFRNPDEQQAIEWDVIYQAHCARISSVLSLADFRLWLCWDKSPGKMNLWVNELCYTSDWMIWMCFHHGVCFLQHCKDFTYRFADSVRQQRFGAVTPGYNFMLTLR